MALPRRSAEDRPQPILALLPDERPWGFDVLDLEEREWRARVFLAVWIQTGSLPFAWFNALQKDPNEAEVKAWVLENLTDEVILDGLKSLEPRRRPACG